MTAKTAILQLARANGWAALVACSAPLLQAQSALTGTVTDAQNAPVPGVEVHAIQTATGLERRTVTSARGVYLLADLPVGRYSVIFVKNGFAEVRVQQVDQSVGKTRALDARLAISAAGQSTTVVAELVPIDRSGAALAAPVERTQLQELPLNGRNWSHLTALVPGATDTGPGDQRTIRFAGHGLDDNNFLVDGVDATGVLNQAQKEYVRLAIPLESIAEFRVQSQNFDADAGTTAGGQVAVVSPSGTDLLRGNVFDYLRNNVLDARSPFDPARPAPFVLNQFGGTLAGPVVQNQTFFFATYEGLRQRLGQTQTGLVPSPAFAVQTAEQSPALAQILAAYPRGTSPTSDPNTWNYVAGANQTDNEDSGMVRLDQHFSARTTAFLRFSADEADYTIPAGALNSLQNTDTKLKNGVVEMLHVFSPALVSEAKFGINQDQYHVATLTQTPVAVKVSGFSALNAPTTSDGQGTTYSWIDNTSWIAGRHMIRFGLEIRGIQMNQGSSPNGTLTYPSLSAFRDNALDSASYTALLPLKRLRKTQAYGYIQDDFKASPNLTITAGLRYSFFNVFHEVNNRAIPFDLETCGGFCPAGNAFSFPRHDDFDPRLAVAWSRGDTALRLGGGIYHSDGQEDDQNLPYANDVQRYSLTSLGFPGLSWPIAPYLPSATGVVTPRDLYRNRKDFYVAAWTASVERKLPSGIIGSASYAGNKGTDILTTTYQNVINPLTGTRPYPQFGIIEFRKNDSNSTFHALQLSARRAMLHNWLFSANYMWSHSINDDGIGGGEADTPQNVSCRACEKASSDFDVRHVFNATAVYRLPLQRGFFGGWQISGVTTERSGLPVNVTVDRTNAALPDGNSVASSERPDLVPGIPLTPPGGPTPNQWINPAAFAVPLAGAWGDAGRNLIRGPRLWQTDLSLARTFSASERLKIQFRTEAYNIFNRAQFGQPLADLSSPINFGRIATPVNQGATGSGTPRQIQFGLKLSF